MNVNCTLLIQMIHFGLAYIVLKKFLFRPTIHVIHTEVKQLHLLQKVIDDRMHDVESKKRTMQQAWGLFYTTLDTITPTTMKYKVSVNKSLPSLTSPVFSQQHMHDIEQEAARACAQKVRHVRW